MEIRAHPDLLEDEIPVHPLAPPTDKRAPLLMRELLLLIRGLPLLIPGLHINNFSDTWVVH